MSGFSVKRVNVVGAFASLWAFIFAFFPFYRIEPMEVLIQQAGKQAESYALTKNLVSYNFFGVLCLMLSIVGNSEIKDIKSIITYAVQYSGSGMKTSMFVKTSVAYGFVLEILMIIIMAGSYWINEFVFKPYVMGDKSGAKINPLEGIVGTAKASYARQFSEHIHMKTSGTEEGKKHPDNILDEKK